MTADESFWLPIVQRIEEFGEEKGLVQSRRSMAYYDHSVTGRITQCMALVWFHRDDRQDVALLYHFTSRRKGFGPDRGKVIVEIAGPFEDHKDQYWTNLRKEDTRGGRFLVDEEYLHYSVVADVPKSPGELLRIELFDDLHAVNLQSQGLNVTLLGGKWLLQGKNIHCQGYIPKKHWHMWTPNARFLTVQ